MDFPEATTPRASRADALTAYLDYFRHQVATKLTELPESAATTSALPSGWSPLELAYHLAHVEMRWLDWGFLGHAVSEPWGDQVDGVWRVLETVDREVVVALLLTRRALLHDIVAAHDLDEVGAESDRWDGEPPATLERVLLHLIQEYARHLGHLDVVVELAGGATRE